jgi:hypothetical protein
MAVLPRHDFSKPHPHAGKMKKPLVADRRAMVKATPPPARPKPLTSSEPVPPQPESDFQKALQTACDRDEVLSLNNHITLDAPIAIRLTSSHRGWFGLDGRMHRITSNVTGQPALRFYMDDQTPQGTCARGMFVGNFSLIGSGNEEGGLQLDVPFNDRWLVNLEMRSIWIESCGGKAACTVAGSIFESFAYNIGTQDNKGAGLYFANVGPSNNKGIVSAFRIFGGTHRQNGGDGILVDQYDGPGDVRMFGLYFCMNAGAGIASLAGLELVADCGFEKNGGLGIYAENYVTLRNCAGSTYGPQPYLVQAYLVNNAMLRSCGVTGYGGGAPRLGKFSGTGTLTLSDSGDASDIDGDVPIAVVQTATG